MNPDLKAALAAQLLALADDELILGHRDSEWCGHAPILEEDIAFANIALDEIGHAVTWYGLLAELQGEDRETYPNRLVYHRDWQNFRSAQIVELPKGDWAFSMLRQYLFDSYEKVLLDRLANSQYTPIADAAAKMRPEEVYHLRHTRAWVRRLGLGTDESNRRMQAALNQLWPYVMQLFMALPDEERVVKAGYFPDRNALCDEWENTVIPYLAEVKLTVPSDSRPVATSRVEHSTDLQALLSSLQEVARLYPDAGW